VDDSVHELQLVARVLFERLKRYDLLVQHEGELYSARVHADTAYLFAGWQNLACEVSVPVE